MARTTARQNAAAPTAPAARSPEKPPAPLAPLAKPRGGATATATFTADADADAPLPEDFCSICQSEIYAKDDRTSCPSCNLTFHAQCWKENLGCSAYGCDQVNALAPAPSPTAAAEEAYDRDYVPQDSALEAQDSTFPWDSVLLALSFVAMAVGAIAYGLPSVATLLIAASLLFTGRARRKGFAVASIVVSLVGIAAGYAMSMFWWQSQRVWERFIRL
jgi:hypothetical protein